MDFENINKKNKKEVMGEKAGKQSTLFVSIKLENQKNLKMKSLDIK